MLTFFVKRVSGLVPVFVVVGITVFLLLHLIPGDPALVILGNAASPQALAALREQLGLNKPLSLQFAAWAGNALKGDLGRSVFYDAPVVSVIGKHALPTISITVVAFLISIAIAIPTALLAVWKRNTFLDPVFMTGSLLGVSVPNFWLSLMLLAFFGVELGWLPVAGYVPLSDGIWLWFSHIIMPSFVLAIQSAGIIARMLRDGMLDVLHQDYIRTARAKGASEGRVLLRHALRNAMLPTVTVIGTSLAKLLGGAVVTEVVFVVPGLGKLLVDSINRRDYPIIQGEVLLIAVIYVLVNLVVDLMYSVLDSRVALS